ncbi:MAG: carboxypeptidase-like regulatory domain-containing protein [Candidatus Thermoplasmatota archaeon]
MLRAVATLALLLTAILAGCSADPSPANSAQEPEAFEDVEVTDTTGAIRGYVVNEAIVPIADVVVRLTGGANQTTDAEGAFVFNGLEPGDYFVSASKLGYTTQQASATVVAGEEPPITKIMLPADKNSAPFATQQTWDGFIMCAFMVANGNLGAQACGPLDDRFIHWFAMDSGIPTYVQAEMVWTSTQALGNALDLEFYDGGTWHFKVVNGESPLVINATKDEIIEWWDANETLLPMRVWPSGAEAVSVAYNQQFTVYMTMFYNITPRQGWTMIEDGACDPVSKCS